MVCNSLLQKRTKICCHICSSVDTIVGYSILFGNYTTWLNNFRIYFMGALLKYFICSIQMSSRLVDFMCLMTFLAPHCKRAFKILIFFRFLAMLLSLSAICLNVCHTRELVPDYPLYRCCSTFLGSLFIFLIVMWVMSTTTSQ